MGTLSRGISSRCCVSESCHDRWIWNSSMIGKLCRWIWEGNCGLNRKPLLWRCFVRGVDGRSRNDSRLF
ncbi:hypothetical protein MPTK1_3g15900 [Marchantia polymorpha subsp. ruderalis]